MNPLNTSVLLIYTGGTIGMIENAATGALENFNFEQLQKYIPELQKFNFPIDTYQFDPPMDSSDMEPDMWRKLVRIIHDNYNRYHGFVILHGTDTMAYTASALSFMLEGLDKPVILTGSQLPIGVLRTDGKENLMTSIEIAIAQNKEGRALVPEVCIFFENHLMRGNRTTKMNAENFNAFRSFNYPVLAEAGIHIKYNNVQIHGNGEKRELKPHYLLDTNVVVLKLFPGIQENVIATILRIEGLKAVVLETYGSGNAPRKEWFIRRLCQASERGIVIVNVTQCSAGMVEMERYETGYQLLQAGVVSGYDSTTESAVTKLMFLLGHGYTPDEVRDRMNRSIAGALTIRIQENECSEKIPPTELPLNIIYEDEDILVINKPAGMPIHPSQNNYYNSLANALAWYYEQQGKPFIFRCTNRLDRDTSGLTIIAKHMVSSSILSQMVREHTISREYRAIVRGSVTPPCGTIDAPLSRKPGSIIERTVDFEHGERAVTHYQVLEEKNGHSLVSLHLETGRTHQIRIHMKYLGFPLIGDYLYNPDMEFMSRQALHSYRMQFTHPITGEHMDFIASLPEDMQVLGFDH